MWGFILLILIAGVALMASMIIMAINHEDEKEKMNKIPLEVKKLAKELGYDTVKYLYKWDGFKCYEPQYSDNETRYVGLPQILLEDNNGKVRLANYEEIMKLIESK